jgi:hypothetical protein
MQGEIAYDVPAAFTAFAPEQRAHLESLPVGVVDICRVAQALLIPPDFAAGVDVPESRYGEREIRAADEMLRVLITLDATPITETRPLEHRVIGTCRDFTVLSCAFLQHRGVTARARCGFAAYFDAESYLDHWVVEYRLDADSRWVRLDSEWLGVDLGVDTEDIQPDEFLTGGEAWIECRAGRIDPARFGVHGVPENFGIGEVRGNAIRDLAALNQVEMLPWDEWGRMMDSYDGKTGPDYDELMDRVAVACASNDPSVFRTQYAEDDLAVPESMIV